MSRLVTLQQIRNPPPQPIGSGGDDDAPYQFWHSPGHLKGSFDITDKKTADAVKRAVNTWIDAWKLLQETSESIRRQTTEESEEREA